MINLAAIHDLCNVTYLVLTAMFGLVFGDGLRLPSAQIAEYSVHRLNRKVYPKRTVP